MRFRFNAKQKEKLPAATAGGGLMDVLGGKKKKKRVKIRGIALGKLLILALSQQKSQREVEVKVR